MNPLNSVAAECGRGGARTAKGFVKGELAQSFGDETDKSPWSRGPLSAALAQNRLMRRTN